jgi:alpha-galactosidase
MTPSRPSRRQFLQWASSVAVTTGALGTSRAVAGAATAPTPLTLSDDAIELTFDERTWVRVACRAGGQRAELMALHASELLTLPDGRRIDEFALREHATESVSAAHGAGSQLSFTGVGAEGVEKTVQVRLYARYPGFALYRVSYRNLGAQPVKVRYWSNGASEIEPLPGPAPAFWSYSGGSYEDRRDWVQPVKAGFGQENFMGMTASDYGGGTPIVDVWRRDCGLAVGHVESAQKQVALPIQEHDGKVRIEVRGHRPFTLAPGDTLTTPETFLAVHQGDYFATLDAYRRLMAERGLRAPQPPAAAYEPIWCAWGYERDCTVPLIEGTLPKVRELGLSWAVVDDGWQSNVGDWNLNRAKFPAGEPDMRRLVGNIRDHGLKPRLWWAPLAAAPGSDLLHDHTDMLLLDRHGTVQNISWWNCFYLCPAYDKTIDYTVALVRRFLGDWGYAGLKIDGQHLNGVAPCYNPAHRHARPEDSAERLPQFFKAIYDAARAVNPQAVVELCPCGTSQSFFNFPYVDQAPASDPESSWQVRLKGKTLKALMGPSAAFAGDHVELSDHGDDFASTFGVGAVVSTKFTWPKDPKPKDSFLLTPERERTWRKWIALYNELRLPEGHYRGGLYDIGFDKPEAHVVEKSNRLYYAFYAEHWDGPVRLRGLGGGTYRVRDYFNARDLGTVSAGNDAVRLLFARFALLEAAPA